MKKPARIEAIKVKARERLVPIKKRRVVPASVPVLALAPLAPLDLKISEMPLRNVPLATDEFPVIAGGLNYKTTIGSLVSASAGGGITVDTGAPYRLIMLSDGTVRAIPIDAVAPAAPTGLAAVVRLTSVNLTWTPAPGAVSYAILRDGVQVGTNTVPDFRDVTILVGTTYSYQVASIDQYQQRSPSSTPVSATIDASLNQAPSGVVITCWPTPIPTDGPALIRVNAYEIDVHDIAFVLNVAAGALRATDDPSVWIITV